MSALVAIFAVIAVVIAAIGASLLATRWVLGPMLPMVQGSTRPTQYRITDLACLIAQLSATSFLLTHLFQMVGSVDAPAFLVLPLWGYFIVAWWAGLQQLTAARVASSLRRSVYLLTVGSVAYLGSVIGPGLLLAAAFFLVFDEPQADRSTAIVAALALAVTFALAVSAKISRWVYAGRDTTDSSDVAHVSAETRSLTTQ